MRIKTIDHVAMTVPYVQIATAFFAKAFDARIVLEGITADEEPYSGEEAELAFGMPKAGGLLPDEC